MAVRNLPEVVTPSTWSTTNTETGTIAAKKHLKMNSPAKLNTASACLKTCLLSRARWKGLRLLDTKIVYRHHNAAAALRVIERP
jgi:hypothetical protein